MVRSRINRYRSHADKAAKYVRVTLGAVCELAFDAEHRVERMRALSAWLTRNGLLVEPKAVTWAMLRRLHEAARAGLYVEEVELDERGREVPRAGDEVRAVAVTLAEGGDCEDWLTVLIAVYTLWGVPFQIVTGGDAADNFQHVLARAYTANTPGSNEGRWYYSDPKGDQSGFPFDISGAAEMEVVRYWQTMRDGAVLTIAEVACG